MCKFIDIIKCGLEDLKAQKKRNRISLILVFLSLITYIGVNSYINSINNSIEASMNALDARVASYNVEEGCLEQDLAMLHSLYDDDERIKEIFQCVPHTTIKWIDASDVLYVNASDISINACYGAVFEYGYKGEEKIPDECEIIMPRYLCEVGIYDEKNMGDGDALIGQKIKLKYITDSGLYSKQYEFEVIGTYDNILSRSVGCIGFVNYQIPLELRELNYDDEEKNIDEILEIDPNYKVIRGKYIGIYVAEGYDIDEVIKDISKDTDGKVNLLKHRIINPTVEGYYQYIMQIGNIISVMLLIIAIINISISSLNEVRDRKWEYSLKMSMGYTKRDIVGIFFVEKLANLMKALILVIFTVGVYCLVATYISQHYLEYWKREYVYTIYPVNVIIAMILIIMAGLIGTLVAKNAIGDINIAKELKSGE